MWSNVKATFICASVAICSLQGSSASAGDLRPSNFSEQIKKLGKTIEYGLEGKYFSTGEIFVAVTSNSNLEKFQELMSISSVLDVISNKEINIKKPQDKIEISIIKSDEFKYLSTYDHRVYKNLGDRSDFIACYYKVEKRTDGLFDNEKTGSIFINSKISAQEMNYCASKAALYFLGVSMTSYEYIEVEVNDPVRSILLHSADTIIAYAASKCRSQKSKIEFDACIDNIIGNQAPDSIMCRMP